MSKLKDLMLSSISRQLGVDVFSRDFLRDPSYFKDRGGRVGGGAPTFQSLLRCLLHSGLSPEDRLRVFPGDFDLGNGRSIQDDLCTYEALIKELGKV